MSVNIIISKDGSEFYVGHIISKSENELKILVKLSNATSFDVKVFQANTFDVYNDIDIACETIVNKTNEKVEILKNKLKSTKRKDYPEKFLMAKKDLINKTKLIAKRISEDDDLSFPDNLKKILKLKDKFYSLSKSLIPEMTTAKQQNDSLNKEIHRLNNNLILKINMLKENYRLAINCLVNV